MLVHFFSLVLAVAAQAQPRLSVTESLRLGALSGDAPMSFGLIASVAVSATGNMYVVDEIDNTVALYGKGGRLIDTFGRAGRGPGEFLRPTAMTLDANDVAYILDRRNARVTILKTVGDQLVHEGEFRLQRDVDDLCSLGEEIYTLGGTAAPTIHVLGSDGVQRSSFGRPFRARSGVALDLGFVTCVPARGIIVQAAERLPIVRAYRRDGEELWSAEVPDFNPLVVTREGQMLRFTRPENGQPNDRITSAEVLADSLLMVQFGPAPAGIAFPEEIVGLTTVFMSLESGEVLGVSKDYPRLDRIRGTVGIGHPAAPYPQLVRYDLKLGG